MIISLKKNVVEFIKKIPKIPKMFISTIRKIIPKKTEVEKKEKIKNIKEVQ